MTIRVVLTCDYCNGEIVKSEAYLERWELFAPRDIDGHGQGEGVTGEFHFTCVSDNNLLYGWTIVAVKNEHRDIRFNYKAPRNENSQRD